MVWSDCQAAGLTIAKDTSILEKSAAKGDGGEASPTTQKKARKRRGDQAAVCTILRTPAN